MGQVNFTRMKDGTRADYQLVTSREILGATDQLLANAALAKERAKQR